MKYKFNCFFCKKEIEVEEKYIVGALVRCPECHKELDIPRDAIVVDSKTGDEEDKEKQKEEKTKYPDLMSISDIFSVIAYILLVGAIPCFLAIFSEFGSDIKLILILSAVGCFIFFIIFRAFSELIKLFIDIEKNTRSWK